MNTVTIDALRDTHVNAAGVIVGAGLRGLPTAGSVTRSAMPD